MNDPACLHPPISLLVKIGSIAKHAEEGLSDSGHAFDWSTIDGLLLDAEVKSWLEQMDSLALLPVAR